MRPLADCSPISLRRRGRRHVSLFPAVAFLLWCICNRVALVGQTSSAPPPPAVDAQQIADIEQRLKAVTDVLVQTQQTLQESLLEVQRLRGQLKALRTQSAPDPDNPVAPSVQSVAADSPSAEMDTGSPSKDDLRALHEEQEVLQSQVEQHEQIKVETASKYPLRLTGLVLFNAFSNAGVVDNTQLPSFALPREPGYSHGSAGATLRQTLLGLEATGPRFAGARSSAEVSMDFFGGPTTNAYGYTSSTGLVRMREAQISLDWNQTTVQAEYAGPLISPLSPTSYATVAQPAFSASGNLWTWSPQVRLEQRLALSDQSRLAFEVGLIDPQSPSYTTGQLNSPVEASRRPGYEARISYHADGSESGAAHRLSFGVGGYSASQYYSSSSQVHSWAATADWQLPIFKWFEVTGEAYRGRAIGGLGGGLYQDVVAGTNPATGLLQITGVEAAGGWSQLKVRFGPTMEANAAFGLDNSLSGNLYAITSYPGANPLQQYARNSSVMGNLIFRPKTYLILSPEYRHLLTWPYRGQANVANIFTLSAGYQF